MSVSVAHSHTTQLTARGLGLPGVVDIRGRRDFSRLDPRPGEPILATLVRPRSEEPFWVNLAKWSSIGLSALGSPGEMPGLAALLGHDWHEGRLVSLAGLTSAYLRPGAR